MSEVKNVSISVDPIGTKLNPQQVWEKEWENLHTHEPNNRQKARRMQKDWEKHVANHL